MFTIQGRGTVATGSVIGGSAATGDVLETHPGGRRCRVRDLQFHGSDAETVRTGQRAALNLIGTRPGTRNSERPHSVV